MSEHPFAPFVRILGRGKRARRDLTRDEAQAAMSAILNDGATDAQLGAFLMLLRVKEETPEELAGFIDVVREQCYGTLRALPPVHIDWPSYAGKKKHSPWYLLSARLLSQQGIKVMMHGGPEHTPQRLYAEQALQQLGLPIASSIEQAAMQLDQLHFCYLPLRHFCPQLDRLLQLREQLGLRSPINTLARSINPAHAQLSLQSVFHPAYLSLHLGAAELCHDKDLLLIKGEGGEIEWRPDARNVIQGLQDGQLIDEVVVDAVISRYTPQSPPSVTDLVTLWRDGDKDQPQLTYGKHAVIHTAALALSGLQHARTWDEALAMASQYWQQRDPL